MGTTTKKELIDRIAARTQQKRVVVKQTIQSFLNEVVAEIGQGNRLEFRDFGVFEIRVRARRVAKNPKTLQPVTVPARRTVKFKLGRQMRASLDRLGPAVGAPALNGVVVKAGKRSQVGV